MNQLCLSIGDKVNIFVKDQQIVLEPLKAKREKADIYALVKQIPDDYEPSEVFNDTEGKEAW